MSTILKQGSKWIVQHGTEQRQFDTHNAACEWANKKSFEAHDAFKAALRNFYAKS